jgi:hypothetical protein
MKRLIDVPVQSPLAALTAPYRHFWLIAIYWAANLGIVLQHVERFNHLLNAQR